MCVCMCAYICMCVYIYICRLSQELRSIFWDFYSRAYGESETSYMHGFNSQQFSSYEFLKYSKSIRKERGALCIY